MLTKKRVFQWLASERLLLIAGFRVVALAFAMAQLLMENIGATNAAFVGTYVLPPAILITGAAAYTSLKLVQPPRWYQSDGLNGLLVIFDLAVCFSLVLLSRAIDGPFTLYTLVPVLTSALLLGRGVTLAVAGTTGTYFAILFFSSPVSASVQHMASQLSTYVLALGFMATLPYAINFVSEQKLESRAITGERSRVGREIHDGLAQDIYGLRWQLQSLARNSASTAHLDKQLSEMGKLLVEAEKDVRTSIEMLRTFRKNGSFLSHLIDCVGQFEKSLGIPCRLVAAEDEPDLDEIVKLQVLLVCQEALRNIAKHARASSVTVKVTTPHAHLRISIADNGRGFDPAAHLRGSGLAVMKERMESLGGIFLVRSRPGDGTEIRMEAPRRCFLEVPTAKP